MSDYIETTDGRVLFLDAGEGVKGGFGVVYKAHFDCSPNPVAIKFMQRSGQAADAVKLSKRQMRELGRKDRMRFENEIAHLREMNDVAGTQLGVTGRPPFADYLGRGTFKGVPFYVMEWLERWGSLVLLVLIYSGAAGAVMSPVVRWALELIVG